MASPDRLGKYQLLRHLASGGMARVYLARLSGLGGFERHVVLKTVRPERVEDASYVAMFLDEARLVSRLHHQHIAQVYDVGRADDGTYYLAMEYVHGETVRALLERARDRVTRLPLEVGLTITCAAAAGLHHAHERRGDGGQPLGIVHRDVSPSNVIIGYDGSIKLIDFGIAKAGERSTKTETGFVKGKAGYMAPEQALGYPVDRRSDVFALGILLYELTTQARAFKGTSEYETVQKIVRGDITPPTKVMPGYPPELEDVVMTALERDPDDRFGDADAMRRAVEMTAHHLGLTLGEHVLHRALGDLFGSKPEPWTVPSGEGEEDATMVATESSPVLKPAARPSTVPAGPLGFARGSGGHSVLPARDEEHDQPTRRFITVEPDDGDGPEPSVVESMPLPPATPTPTPMPMPAQVLTAPPGMQVTPRPAPVVPPPLPRVAQVTPLPPTPPTRARTARGSDPVASSPPAAARSGSFEVTPLTPLTPTPKLPRDSAPMLTPVPISSLPSVTTPTGLPAVTVLPPVPPRITATGTSPKIGPIAAPPRRRTGTIVATASSIVLAIGIIAALSGGDDPGTPYPDPAAATGDPGADPGATHPDRGRNPATRIEGVQPAPAPVPPPEIEIEDEPPPTTAGPVVHVRVTTTPDDATVVLDGVRLGRSPLDVTVPVGRKDAVLKVRKRGYFTAKVEVSLDKDVTWDVRLKRR